jgi:hypothetical protein
LIYNVIQIFFAERADAISTKKQLKHNALEAKRKSGKGVGIRLTLNAIKDKKFISSLILEFFVFIFFYSYTCA